MIHMKLSELLVSPCIVIIPGPINFKFTANVPGIAGQTLKLLQLQTGLRQMGNTLHMLA